MHHNRRTAAVAMEAMDLNRSSATSESTEEDSAIEVDTSVGSKTVHFQFFLFCISVLCSISSYSGLIDLQSSINVSDALGNRSLMLMSISTVICCLFMTPVVTVAFGAKNTILFSQFCYIVYVLSNFYPAPYVLLPGGVFLGIAEGFLYAPCLMYCTYFGRKLAGVNSHKTKDSINQFVGYFWAIYQMNEIIGNAISATILNLGKTTFSTSDISSMPLFNTSAIPSMLATSNHTFSLSAVENFTATASTSHASNDSVRHYSMCGANDCYDENAFETKHGSYVPASKSAVYTMLGVYTFLAVIALPIMWITPSLPRKTRKFIKVDTYKVKKNRIYVRQIWRHFKKTLTQLARFQQLLITPLTLYHGLYVSFISSEISRAFVSCTVGVEMVGLGFLGGGIVNVFVSFLYGALSGSNICHNILLLMAIIVDALLYVVCLTWVPTEDTSYMGLIICIVFGFSDGVWSPLLDGKCAKYFSKNEEVAYSVNNFWNCIGFTLMYGWTTLLCVRQKIYIQLFSLCFGVVCFCGAEIFYKRNQSQTVET